MIGHNGAIGCYVVFSILNTVQLEHGHAVEVYHVADDVVRCLLFLEQEAAGWYPMFQRNGSHADRTVIVNDFGLGGVDGMEGYFVGHAFAEKFQLWG